MFRLDKKNDKKLVEKIEDLELKNSRYETRLRGECCLSIGNKTSTNNVVTQYHNKKTPLGLA